MRDKLGRFIKGHKIGTKSQFKRGKLHPNYKYGGRSHHTYRKDIEKGIGKKLLPKQVIHHKDRNPSNNKKSNIIIFPSHSKHMKYHWKIQKEKNIKGRMKQLK